MTNGIPPESISANDIDNQAPLQTNERKHFQLTIAELIARVDHEAKEFRRTIAELLIEIETLRQAAKERDIYDVIAARLTEANQNLIIATFDAQDLQAKAEADNLRREEFLAMLAHELRNPLTPVSMAAELLGQITSAHPQLPKLHAIICRQINHMTRLVDDLVDASRINSGKVALQKHPILLSEIIQSAIETSQPFVDKRQQHLTVDLSQTPIAIDGDLVRLAQVFSNLIINATKFTPEDGQIAVVAHTLADTVTVSVKDNGVGIPLALQPFIFDLFTQGEHSLDRSQGGLGIGLSLVRTIVEMHGGTVAVRSEGTGLGSKFTVVLPTCNQAIERDIIPAAIVISDQYCRILLIEDNADTNETLNKVLSHDGHTITCAYDGVTGLERAKEQVYDVIICDIGLPGMSGNEVVSQLPRSRSAAPYCIAISGYGDATSRARAIDAGFDQYMIKPVNIETLRSLIASRSQPV